MHFVRKVPKIIINLIKISFLSLGVYLLFVCIWTWLVTPQAIKSATKEERIYLSDLPPDAENIILAVEDPSFYNNVGIDLITPGQGLTTISQSLARDLYITKPINGVLGIPQNLFRLFWKYLKSIDLGRDVMALVLNTRVEKKMQLELFLSNVYMGNIQNKPVIGLKSAAKIYIKKELKDLSLNEVIYLTAMMKAPNEFNPKTNISRHTERVRRIQLLIDKKCQPINLFDSSLKGCATKNI